MKAQYHRLIMATRALVAVFALGVIVACATAPASSPTTALPPATVLQTTAPSQATAPAEAVKISVYSVAWSPTDQAMVSKLIDLFNQEHQGQVQAELVQGDWGQADSYITSGVAGGGGIADVIEYANVDAASWNQKGFLLDLRPYLNDAVRATMPPELWQARSAPDGSVFMSGTVTGEHLVIYYNPELFAKAGVEPPAPGAAWTWDEFLENAKKLTVDANGKHPGEEGFDAAHVVQWGFVPRLDTEKVWEEGGNLAMQTNGQYLVRRGTDGKWGIFFDDAALAALRSYLRVIQEGITPPAAIGLTGDSQDEMFHQGQAAMVMRAYFNIGVLHDKWPDFKFAVMPTPRSPDQKDYYVSTVGQGYVVPKTTKHPAEAAEFAFWLQNAKPNAMRASSLFLAPVNPVAFDDPLLKDNKDWDTMRALQSISKVVTVEPNPHLGEFLTTSYGPTMIAVAQGDKTLEDAVAEVKSSADTILNQP